MNDNRLDLASYALEQLLRQQLRLFHSFEVSGTTPMEQLGIDARHAAQLVPLIERTLGIALPDFPRHNGVFQTPNMLLAFVCATELERAMGTRPSDYRSES